MKLIGSAYQSPVPRDSSLELRVVRRVQPDDSPAPTEAGDGKLARLALARFLRPCRGRVEIRHHLRVGNLRHNFRNDVVDVSDLRYIALACVQLRSNRHVAELCETAADVLDVFVHAEDLLNDQHDRDRPAFVGHGSIGGDIAVGDGDLYFAGDQSVRVGGDCLGGYWLDGQREPGCESGDYKFSPGQRDLWLESGQVFKHMSSPRGIWEDEVSRGTQASPTSPPGAETKRAADRSGRPQLEKEFFSSCSIQRDRHELQLAFAFDLKRDFFLAFHQRQCSQEFLTIVDRRSIHSMDHVAATQTSLRGGTVRLHVLNHHAAGHLELHLASKLTSNVRHRSSKLSSVLFRIGAIF